jgi:membrane associated rhomboid family serine protease
MVTLIIILLTAAVSILCFTRTININALKFNAYDIVHRGQWYRMLSYGFVHGGWGHLIFNMLTLYFFGTVVERYFCSGFGDVNGVILYVKNNLEAIR